MFDTHQPSGEGERLTVDLSGWGCGVLFSDLECRGREGIGGGGGAVILVVDCQDLVGVQL